MIWGRKPKIEQEEATIVSIVTPEAETSEPLITKAPPSVIGAQTNILGSIVSAGDLSVDGNVEGDVRCALFTVGANGHVAGNVTAETATVRGRISGNVVARTILLAGTGSIDGDLTHAVLIIEEGGVFEGRSKRLPDPLAVQTPALGAPINAEENTIIDKTKPVASKPRAKAKKLNQKTEEIVTEEVSQPSALASELSEDFAVTA